MTWGEDAMTQVCVCVCGGGGGGGAGGEEWNVIRIWTKTQNDKWWDQNDGPKWSGIQNCFNVFR